MDIGEFREWLEGHRERHPFARLPEFDAASVMYASWFKVLLKRGVNNVVALEEASNRLYSEPAKHLMDHFPVLCGYAEEAMRARGNARPSHDTSTREGAKAAAKGCERCGGEGLTVAWHSRPDPAKRIAPTAPAYCVCDMGRWTERNHSRRPDGLRKMFVDFADVLAGRSEWKATEEEAAAVAAEMEESPF